MTVYLVGAGPGDPGLLTLRAAEILRRADAVVHDRLVDDRVLALAPAAAVRHDVGKRPGRPVAQDEINELLVSLAKVHSCVVRVKGGDPYLFGRGGEEALALQQANVSFEVVPGVSSVNGALAYAGIPITQRGRAASVCIVTGHGADGSALGGPVPVDWDGLARVGGTIVVLMGVANRAEISERLIEGGLDPKTPAAVIAHATLPAQKTVRTTLDRLGATEPETPAIIVVGEVAALDLSWFEQRPLLGWRVVVTRSREQASSLARRLTAEGAVPIEVPTIEIVEPDDGGASLSRALGRVGEFEWIAFASTNAVESVFARLHDARALAGLKVAAVGRSTAEALAAHGIVADLVPPVAVAEELASSFGRAPGEGAKVLLPQAAGARNALSAGLAELGYEVEVAHAYRTVHPELDDTTRAVVVTADAVTFASSSSVEGLVALVGAGSFPPVVASIGPVTSRTVRSLGLEVQAEASEASVDGLVDALCAFAAAHPRAE